LNDVNWIFGFRMHSLDLKWIEYYFNYSGSEED